MFVWGHTQKSSELPSASWDLCEAITPGWVWGWWVSGKARALSADLGSHQLEPHELGFSAEPGTGLFIPKTGLPPAHSGLKTISALGSRSAHPRHLVFRPCNCTFLPVSWNMHFFNHILT